MLGRLLKSLMLEPPKVDDVDAIAYFDIPENDAILRQLHKFKPTYSYANRTQEVRGRYAIMRQIDGHPDSHDYLWERAGAHLPLNARWIIRATAAFAHPKTRIIFAIAGGTHSVQIRIPLTQLDSSHEQTQPHMPGANTVWIGSRNKESDDQRLMQIAFDAASLPTS